jgi:hypothetical protein
MRNALVAAGLAVVPAAVAVVLAMPVTAVSTQALHAGLAVAGPVTAEPARASWMFAGKLDLILRLMRCPVIKNGNTAIS